MALHTPMETRDARDRYFLTRIETITDQDFWSAIRSVGPFREAVTAGRVGHREQAYRLLGRAHAQTLASEAADARMSAAKQLANADAQARSRSQADAVLRHEIALWHETQMTFGERIDFSPDVTPSVLYGYHYLGCLAPLHAQLALAGNPRDRDGLLNILYQYYEQRTSVPWAIPWWSPVYYELGARAKLGLFLTTYAMVCDDDAVTTDQRESMLKLLLGFGRSLYRIQTDEDFRPGNWQLGGCAALYQLGAAMPEFKEATRWREIAQRLLRRHADEDFFSDGGHSERTWDYGFICLRGIQTFYECAQRHGHLSPSENRYWSRFLKRAYQWFAKTLGPGENKLCYNDGILGPGQAIRESAERVFPQWAAEPHMFGVDRSQSYLLKPSGFALMRAQRSPAPAMAGTLPILDDNDPFVSINFGPDGGVHTHADALDFTFWSHGQPLIEEVGRFGDYDSPLNPLFRSDVAHNQVIVEHHAMNRKAAQGQDVAWHSDSQFDLFSAWHEGYPNHRIHRMVLLLKPDCLLVYDVISTKYVVRQLSHLLHAPRPFKLLGNGRAQIVGSPSCLIQFAQPADLREQSTHPDYTAADYGYPDGDSPHLGRYPHSLERYRLTTRQWHSYGTKAPIRFAVLMTPFAGKQLPDATITSLPVHGDASDQAAAYEVTSAGGQYTVVLNPARANLRYGRRDVTTLATVWKGRTRTDVP